MRCVNPSTKKRTKTRKNASEKRVSIAETKAIEKILRNDESRNKNNNYRAGLIDGVYAVGAKLRSNRLKDLARKLNTEWLLK